MQDVGALADDTSALLVMSTTEPVPERKYRLYDMSNPDSDSSLCTHSSSWEMTAAHERNKNTSAYQAIRWI